MTNNTQNTSIQKVITFSPTLFKQANQKAKKMGVGFPEYIRHLLLNDIQTSKYDEGIKNSLEDIRNGDYQVLKTKDEVKEFVQKL